MCLLEKVRKLLTASQAYIVFIIKAGLSCLKTPRIYLRRKDTERYFGYFFPDEKQSETVVQYNRCRTMKNLERDRQKEYLKYLKVEAFCQWK